LVSLFTKLFKRIESGAHIATKVAAIVAEVALCAMVVLTVADVFGRYFFNSPITGTYELVGLLLVCAGTWGWAYCQLKKKHISISIVTEHLRGRAQAILACFGHLIGLVGFSLLCWRVFLLAWKYIFMARGGITLTLGIPFFPFMLMLAIAAGLIALILLIDLVKSLAKAVQR
jgi:TRAP-type C4-dicarboxylate transport system permease small subunit